MKLSSDDHEPRLEPYAAIDPATDTGFTFAAAATAPESSCFLKFSFCAAQNKLNSRRFRPVGIPVVPISMAANTYTTTAAAWKTTPDDDTDG